MAGAARERAAKLETRAGEIGRELEREKISRLELERKYAWRRISQEQGKKILGALGGKQFSMYFEFLPVDPEASRYAEDLLGVLKAAQGTNIWPPHPLTLPPPPPGVTISGTKTLNRDALEAAFKNADIEIKTNDNTPGDPRLSIGSRLPPL
jgi:hypothetical protein